jgi:arsenate reductase
MTPSSTEYAKLMTDYTLFHNPRCSKSRQTLALLEDNGIQPTIVKYLDDTPDAATLKTLVKKLGLPSAHDLVRNKEADYKTAGLSAESSDDEVIAAMVQYPKLIERPILVRGNKAVLGRPPENALNLLD